MEHLFALLPSSGDPVLEKIHAYRLQLRQLLMDGLASDSVLASVLISPSFEAAYSVVLICKDDQYAVVAATASRNVWFSQDQTAPVSVRRSERKIGKNLAVAITELWAVALRDVRVDVPQVLDGVHYEFAAGDAVGFTADDPDSLIGQLPAFAELLYKFATSDFAPSPICSEAGISRMAVALAKKLQGIQGEVPETPAFVAVLDAYLVRREHRGCTIPEIAKLERDFHVTLPADYRLFLEKMGRGASGFMTGSDWEHDKLAEIQGWAKELLDECEMSPLPVGSFAIAMHQGYQFFFLQNGRVYYFMEGSKEFSLKYDSFEDGFAALARA